MRRVTLIWRGSVEALPPAVSLARQLTEVGCRVSWIAGTATSQSLSLLSSLGIECIPLEVRSAGSESMAEKATNALVFRARAWRAIRALAPHIPWVLNTETAIVLGKRLLDYPYLLHMYELHDSVVKQLLGDVYIRGARCVICPEPNRASIIRSLHHLSYTPIVIPNVPVGHDSTRRQSIENPTTCDELQSLISRGLKIALYQGRIQEDRDLSSHCRVFARRAIDWRLVLMGRDYGCLKRYQSLCPTLLHIDHLDAPMHMQVTSWATVGIVAYNYDSLNNIFCAPNKIYEYGSFGIPMLANDVPGLRNAVTRYSAGVCAETSDEDLAGGLSRLEKDYSSYSAGALEMFQRAAQHELPQGVRNALRTCE